ncbi:DUF2815 family protein [Symbiopectobacterium sp.]|uniref:DUF2815 family protein n=1 Tax=Symbiopectobacterium sp. TaxID=2952789 RepID=UPI003F3577EA
MKVKLNNVRLAFPALFESKAVNSEGEPRFSAVFLLDARHPQLNEFRNTMKQAAKEKWGEKWEPLYNQLEKKLNLCLHDGDEKVQYEGFSGNYFISTSNKARPLVVDRDRSALTAADGKPYAGCYVNVTLDIWAMDNKFGKRINASLSGVQFLRDGDAFSGSGVASVDDFEPITEGADAEALI